MTLLYSFIGSSGGTRGNHTAREGGEEVATYDHGLDPLSCTRLNSDRQMTALVALSKCSNLQLQAKAIFKLAEIAGLDDNSDEE